MIGVKHKMKINIYKSVFIRFDSLNVPVEYKINVECIKRVEYAKDLGVLVDRKLSFSEHCLKVVHKSSFLSMNILKIFKFCDSKNKSFLFKTYIKPISEYKIPFYYPTSKKCVIIGKCSEAFY